MDEIPFVGDGIKRKVAEFLDSGKVNKLQSLKSDPKIVFLEQLGQIWGVGPAAADKIYACGVRSFAGLRKR